MSLEVLKQKKLLECLALQVKILKQYIFTYSEFLNEMENVQLREKLSVFTSLYQSVIEIEEECDFDRNITSLTGVSKTSKGSKRMKSSNPRMKYKMKAEEQKEGARRKFDFSISNSSSRKKSNFKKNFK